MSESLRSSPELIPVHETAAALNDWLAQEIVSSSEGRNRVLDDWDKYQEGLRLPFNDSKNSMALKAYSHFQRLRNWTLGFEEYPDLVEDEYYMARQLFAAQMEISGGFRRQCYVEAANAEDYRQRRFETGPMGINLEETIATRLNDYTSGDMAQNAIYPYNPSKRLVENTDNTNEEYLLIVESVHEIAQRDAGKEGSQAVQLLKEAQRMWTQLCVDYIMYAVNQSGKPFAEVAFLEPKSISDDPQIYYPFASVKN